MPRVFVVDDDASVRTAIRRLLQSAGHTVETFSSGRALLDSITPDTGGVLVLDLKMPGMDGFQVQQRLGEIRSPLKVVFVTAHAQAGDREQAMGQGAAGFLVKPFEDESLLDLVAGDGSPRADGS